MRFTSYDREFHINEASSMTKLFCSSIWAPHTYQKGVILKDAHQTDMTLVHFHTEPIITGNANQVLIHFNPIPKILSWHSSRIF